MDSIKHSPEALLTFGIINAIGRANPDKVLPSPASCGDAHHVPDGAWI